MELCRVPGGVASGGKKVLTTDTTPSRAEAGLPPWSEIVGCFPTPDFPEPLAPARPRTFAPERLQLPGELAQDQLVEVQAELVQVRIGRDRQVVVEVLGQGQPARALRGVQAHLDRADYSQPDQRPAQSRPAVASCPPQLRQAHAIGAGVAKNIDHRQR